MSNIIPLIDHRANTARRAACPPWCVESPEHPFTTNPDHGTAWRIHRLSVEHASGRTSLAWSRENLTAGGREFGPTMVQLLDVDGSVLFRGEAWGERAERVVLQGILPDTRHLVAV